MTDQTQTTIHARRWRDTIRSRVFWRAFFDGTGLKFTPEAVSPSDTACLASPPLL